MIHMWFTGMNYYKLAVERDLDSIFTTLEKNVKSILRNLQLHH
jgi:hypothetical protein